MYVLPSKQSINTEPKGPNGIINKKLYSQCHKKWRKLNLGWYTAKFSISSLLFSWYFSLRAWIKVWASFSYGAVLSFFSTITTSASIVFVSLSSVCWGVYWAAIEDLLLSCFPERTVERLLAYMSGSLIFALRVVFPVDESCYSTAVMSGVVFIIFLLY